MGNCLFGWPNHVDATSPVTVSFSGGDWASALPLTNLRDPLLHRVARTNAATLAAAQFDVDLGAPARYIRLFAIPRHNLKQTAKVRIRGSSSSSNYGKAQELTATANGGVFSKTVVFGSGGAKYVSVHIERPSTTPATTFRLRLTDSGATVRLLTDVTVAADGSLTPSMSIGTSLGTVADDGYVRLKLNTTAGLVAGTATLEIFPNGTAANGLELIVTNVYVTESSSDSAYTEGGSNLMTAPWDFTTWTATNASVVRTGLDEPNGPQTYDTGWLDAWPIMWDVGALPWGSPNLWTRRLTDEQIVSYRAGFVHVAPTAYQGQYWRWEFNDTTNPDGYIQLHRLVMSPGYVPTINMSFGAQFGPVDTTTFEESLGGTRYYDERPQRKVMNMVFDDLPEDELLGVMQEMQRSLGVSKQVYFIHAVDDTFHLLRRSMLATFKELSPLEYAYYGRGKLPVLLEEVL